MPLADSVVLTTILRLSGTIFAPDESSSSWTLLATPLVSKPFNGMTFSLLFTGQHVSEAAQSGRTMQRTVEATSNRLFVLPLLYDKLDMGMCACDVLEMLVKVRAEVV